MEFPSARAVMIAAACALGFGAGGRVAADPSNVGAGANGSVELRPSISDAPVKLQLTPPKPKKEIETPEPEAKPAPKRSSTRTAVKDEPLPSAAGKGHAIVALVNDDPITGYELDQRAAMLSGNSAGLQAKSIFEGIVKNPKTTERLKAILKQVIAANQGKSQEQVLAIFEKRKKEFGMGLQREAMEKARAAVLPGVKKQAMDELIDERLKLQEAKRQNAVVGEDEVDKVVTNLAERNKMTVAEFTKQVGGNIEPMKSRVRATLSWNEVVRRRFGAVINVNTRDVDKLVASSATFDSDAQLRIQRIRVAMPSKLEERGVAKRMQEAEIIRSKFTDCKSMSSIVMGVPGAKFEDLGERRTSAFAEPTKSLLASAGEGEMLPPAVGEGWIELFAVCSKNTANAQEDKRSQAEDQLKVKEFELMSKRYIKDLRQDARIEYR